MTRNRGAGSVAGVRRILLDLEASIVYGMTIVGSVIGILVWGVSKSGRTRGALFDQFQSVFGVEYGVLFTLILFLLLLSNRRWKGLAVLVGAWLLIALLELNPMRTVGPGWDECFALGAMLSSLILAFCVWYELLD